LSRRRPKRVKEGPVKGGGGFLQTSAGRRTIAAFFVRPILNWSGGLAGDLYIKGEKEKEEEEEEKKGIFLRTSTDAADKKVVRRNQHHFMKGTE
jgi:hypothetical protein